jgi:hypothetical protein
MFHWDPFELKQLFKGLVACKFLFCGSGILPRSSWLEATPTRTCSLRGHQLLPLASSRFQQLMADALRRVRGDHPFGHLLGLGAAAAFDVEIRQGV